jgi:hypothetical protein
LPWWFRWAPAGGLSRCPKRSTKRASTPRDEQADRDAREIPERGGGVLNSAGTFAALEETTQGFSDRLQALEPPAEVADTHRRVVDALDGFGERMDALAQAADRGDDDAVAKQLRGGVDPEALRAVEDAFRTFEEKGYDLRGFGE